MKVVKLNSQPREAAGTGGARKVRRAGRTPAVVYGEGKTPEHVSLPGHEFRLAVDAGARVVDLEQGGGEPQRVLLSDVQFDAMGLKLLHADFLRLDPAHEITLRIPVHVEGAPKGLAEGGVLTIVRDVLAVRCLPKDIPESVHVDVSHLGLGETFEAGMLELPAGVSLAEDAHDVLVGCMIPKVTKSETAAAPAEGAAEGAAPAAAGATPAAPGAAAGAGAAPAAGAKGAAPASPKEGKGGEKKK